MKCSVCGGNLAEGRCVRCYGLHCTVCQKPIYRDESFQRTTTGARHIRCLSGPAKRPYYMRDPKSAATLGDTSA